MKRVRPLTRLQVAWRLCSPQRMTREEMRGIMLLCFCAFGSSMSGQAIPTAVSAVWKLDTGAFVTANVVNTQFPFYADNAAGLSFGVFAQSSHLVGAEVRGGYFPISARFRQAPITAGLRVISKRSLSSGRWQPFGYVGGGISRAQDSGPNYQPTAAQWSPCWQASGGVDVLLGRISWRVLEASWTKTYSRNDLRSISGGTGIVYRFGFRHNREVESTERDALAIAQMPYAMTTNEGPTKATAAAILK
jgi:hypothetical protein